MYNWVNRIMAPPGKLVKQFSWQLSNIRPSGFSLLHHNFATDLYISPPIYAPASGELFELLKSD